MSPEWATATRLRLERTADEGPSPLALAAAAVPLAAASAVPAQQGLVVMVGTAVSPAAISADGAAYADAILARVNELRAGLGLAPSPGTPGSTPSRTAS